jgi:hypothetical protein
VADYGEWVVQVGDARACTLASLRRAGGEGVCASGQEGGCAGGGVALPDSTLDKAFAERYTRQRVLYKHFIGKGFFVEYFFGRSAKTLPNVEKHSAKKSTRQIKNHKKTQKSKTFLNYGNNSPTTTHYHTHRTIIFHYYFELNLHVLCRNLSRAYPPLPLHYYINYVYITFSFLM